MSAVTLHPVAEADAAEVLHFELENRTFFERFIAGFGDDYYQLKHPSRNKLNCTDGTNQGHRAK